MGIGIVYILNQQNEIVEKFEVDWEVAINNYWGKRDHRGRFHIAPKGIEVPYKMKQKDLKDFKRPTRQEA
ncbi:hypothetical protein [Nitrosopumilus sp.]|uniref:hypothetical protein n=1 Tax=Nitrosopumilus sp. TaxID=2024843 RepID=UPI003D10287A